MKSQIYAAIRTSSCWPGLFSLLVIASLLLAGCAQATSCPHCGSNHSRPSPRPRRAPPVMPLRI